MERPPPTRRRWVRYSLRTLFVLVTLVCIYLGWAMNWIRQRHAFLDRPETTALESDYVRAPESLRLMGESGVQLIYFQGSEEELKQVENLFPEARWILLSEEQPPLLDPRLPTTRPALGLK